MESIVGQVEYHQSLSEKVNELLDERQQMLVLFCRVAGLGPDEEVYADTELLQKFCQVLVDYSALWHFEIIDAVVKDNERFFLAFEQASHANDKILIANEVAVAFNDKYDSSDHELTMDDFNFDLSNLGEELAGRIEAEDHILQAMSV